MAGAVGNNGDVNQAYNNGGDASAAYANALNGNHNMAFHAVQINEMNDQDNWLWAPKVSNDGKFIVKADGSADAGHYAGTDVTSVALAAGVGKGLGVGYGDGGKGGKGEGGDGYGGAGIKFGLLPILGFGGDGYGGDGWGGDGGKGLGVGVGVGVGAGKAISGFNGGNTATASGNNTANNTTTAHVHDLFNQDIVMGANVQFNNIDLNTIGTSNSGQIGNNTDILDG